MEFVKKLLPLLIIAAIFAVGGYFIGKAGMQNQEASIYKGLPNITNPENITHLLYANGACRIYKWNSSNNTWTETGTLGGVNERNCHDFIERPSTTATILKTNGMSAAATSVSVDTTNLPGVINMGWTDGIGCSVFRWNDNTKSWDSLGIATGVSKENCVAIILKPKVPASVKTTLPTAQPTKTQ
jgi:hypothetical protein